MFTVAPDVVALLWIQSRMVFYIAAAHGYDPRHPMRPAEFLALQGLYETPAEARSALDGVGKHLAQAAVGRAISSRNTDALHMRLAKYLAKRLARRYAGRYVPLIGAPMGHCRTPACQAAGAACARVLQWARRRLGLDGYRGSLDRRRFLRYQEANHLGDRLRLDPA